MLNTLRVLSKFVTASRNTIKPPINLFHASAYLGVDYRGKTTRRLPQEDQGTQGEKLIDLDSMITSGKASVFPTADSDNMLFNGTPYKDLPICNIKVTQNNTIISLTNPAGVIKLTRSCGVEGFKNTKKGTNIAAQTTAITLGQKAIEKGFSAVRVKVRGLGPGRLAAVKGLQMGGLSIVSITDNTKVSWNPPRPRKAKRL